MRSWSLISLLLVTSGCTVRVPRFTGSGRIHVNANVTANVQTNVQVRAVPLAPPPPPPPPAPPVEIRNAPVVEFFGIPLEGATEIVFVLDCSGSMDELARGRIAQLDAVAPAPEPAATPAEPAPPQPAPDAGAAPVEPMPPQPVADPNMPPAGEPAPPPAAPDPNAPAVAAPPPPRQPRKIDVAQVELVEALRRLPTGTAMNVLFFNDEIDGYAPNLVPLQDPGRDGLITFVLETAPQGKTALVPAMRAALLMNPRRIVLLSDGLGNVGGNSSVLLQDVREAVRGGVRIDAIGLGDDQDAELLQTIAAESGGLYQGL